MKRIFLIGGFCLFAYTNLWSQAAHYSLNSNESGQTKSYIARDYIKLLPGFTYKATGNTTFTSKIDAGLLFPPTEPTPCPMAP